MKKETVVFKVNIHHKLVYTDKPVKTKSEFHEHF